MLKALQFGNDEFLMRSRSAVMGSAGFQVRSLLAIEARRGEVTSSPWNVAILCHTLSTAERAAIVAELRRSNPKAPILLVNQVSYAPASETDGLDGVLDAHPDRMLRGLSRVMTQVA